MLSELKGFGPGDHRLGRQRTLHAPALLRLVVSRLFLRPLYLEGPSGSLALSAARTQEYLSEWYVLTWGGQSRRFALYWRC